MEIRKGRLLLEEKTKKIYPTNDPGQLIIQFKDDISLGHENKIKIIKNKGEYNTTISSTLFKYLNSYHIHNHFVKIFKPNEMLVKRLEMIPVEVVIWNFSAEKIARRYGLDKWKPFPCPIMELHLKNEKLHHPMITIDHACAFGYAIPDEMQYIDRTTRKANAVLKSYFDRRGFKLVYFKLEFGRVNDHIVLGDEISPDTFNLWDVQSDMSRYVNPIRFLPDEIESSYEDLKNRICK